MINSPEAGFTPNISPSPEKMEVKEPIFKVGDRVAITGVIWKRVDGSLVKIPATLVGRIDAPPVTTPSNIAVIQTYHEEAYFEGSRFEPTRPPDKSATYYRVDVSESLKRTVLPDIIFFAENQLDVPR